MRKLLNILAVIIFLAAIGFMFANSILSDRQPYKFADAENTINPPHTDEPSSTPITDTTADDTTADDTVSDATTDDTAEADTSAGDTLTSDTSSADTSADTTAPLVAPPVDLPSPTKEMADKIDAFLATLDSTEVLLSVGYEISDKVYGEGLRLSLLTREITDNNTYSLRSVIEKEPVRIPDEVYGTYTTELRDRAVNLPLIHIYMDYLFVDNGGSFKVYTKSGNLIYEEFNADEFVPAYTRDKANNPLFSREEVSEFNPANTVAKYYYLDDIGALLESDYDDKADNRGLYMNYPSYFGVSDNELSAVYSESSDTYAYAYADGTKKCEFIYKNTYNFSEGYGAIVDADGVLNFIDSGLRSTLYAHDWSEWYYNHSGRRVRDLLAEPDTRGIESLGFFYFENGLCRVRRQVVDAYNWEATKTKIIASDTDIIIRSDGTEFPIPTDYTVVAYGNGMILLEKNGLYGYMDSTGKWVLQPIYTYAEPFSEGLAVVGKDGKMGIVDTSGNFLVPMLFDHIESPSGGLIALYDVQHGWTVMNKCYYPQDSQIAE